MKRGVVKFTLFGIGLFVFMYLIFFIPNAKSNPDTGITNCTNLTTAGETYTLTNNIHNDQISDTCINAFASNVTLDCQGKYISSIQNYSGIYSNSTNSTIKNCNITMGSGNNANANAIYLRSSNYSTLFNNSIFGEGYSGIWFYSSYNSTITSNVGISNSSIGIYFQYSSNNNLTNNTITSNSGAGIWLSSSSNNNFLTNNTGTSNSSAGIYISLSSNNTILTNNTGTSNSYPGIFISSSSNNILTSNIGRSNSDNAGFLLQYSSNNTLTSNIGTSNSSYGILLQSSSNNTLTSNIGTSNSSYGIYIYSLNNSILTSNTGISNFSAGIYVLYSFNNTISNSILSNNVYGLYLFSSNGTIVTNITTKNNSRYGIVIQGGSYNNTIKNSFIQYNNLSGLLLNSTGTAPQYNLFYNNYFNNSAQYSNISVVSTNYFNTTKTAGTNIVGGNYLAGNYWAALNGTGFSQTCSDANGDGICDSSYQLDILNYDYLPLTCTEIWSCTAWSSCSGNTQTRTCTDANLCQTYRTKPVESQTCSGTGDSAVPGAGGTTQTSAISSITPETPAVIEITNHYMSATKITINVNRFIQDASLTITEVNITSGGFQIGFQGLPYQAFEIVTQNLSNADIKNASIEFKVNKTELLAHNLTIDDVFLYRKPINEIEWSALNTTYLSNDSSYYYFSSVTPGFSTFLIFASKEECVPAEKRCFENQVQFCLGNKRWLISEVCDYKCLNGKCVEKGLQINLNPLVVYPIIGIVVVGVLISFFAQRMIKRKNTYYTSMVNRRFGRR